MDQKLFQIDWAQVVDSSKEVFACFWISVEVVVEHVALHRELFGARAKHFHEQSKVVIVLLVIVFAWSRVEQEIAGYEFKDHACITPEISACVIVNSQNNFWCSVLPCLNLWHEVVMGPTPVSEITNFAVNGLIYQRPFHIYMLLISQILLSRVHQPTKIITFFGWKLSVEQLLLLPPEFPFEHEVFLDFVFEVALLLENVVLPITRRL